MTAGLIPLDPAYFHDHGRDATEQRFRQIAGSVRFELLEQPAAVRLLGPDMKYHAIDPHLPNALTMFNETMGMSDILSWKRKSPHFDLCLEDSWSGCFIAELLRELRPEEDLVLIHLDDHTDMMPTLLSRSGGELMDLAADRQFNPTEPDDWAAAIYSGSVGIGSFITPLYYSGHQVHVRHLNNNETSATNALCDVSRDSLRHDLIPEQLFAAVRRTGTAAKPRAGTYLGTASADEVLRNLPQGRVVAHIDLDYFVNDFNGNFRTGPYAPPADLIHDGGRKMRSFFASLDRLAMPIDRWVIATSPGFCSACHWPWLLAELAENIERFTAR